MQRIIFLLISLVTTAPGIQAQDQHILKSKNIQSADTVWVFTPSVYKSDPEKSFPLIYMLNGWSGSYHQWNDIIGCQNFADRYGFIIVCPDGLFDSWYINSPAIAGSRYSDFFFSDLMPFIAENYRVDRENIFITGLSMGGHGALYLFAMNPGLFRSAGSLSGVLDLSICASEYRINDYLGIREPNSNDPLLKTYSVAGNIKRIAASGKEIIFTCGTSDRFYAVNNQFKTLCDEYRIAATYIISPGGHDYAYWKSAIGYHFDFFNLMVKSGK